MAFKYGDMVFAKCQNYPYWPGKVIATFANSNSLKILFYGEKSQATIDLNNIIPFTQQSCRKFSSEGAAKTNQALRYSIKVALKRFHKRKKGENSESEDDFCGEETKKEERSGGTKGKAVQMVQMVPSGSKLNDNPYVELGKLLNAFAEEASNAGSCCDWTMGNGSNGSNGSNGGVVGRRLTGEQVGRLRTLLDPSSNLVLPMLIDNRIIDKLIVVLKELDMWGVGDSGQLLELREYLRKRYEDYRAIILSAEFASMPLRESKREYVVQKVLLYRAMV